MESFITLLALLLLVIAAVFACLAIYNRKRQPQTQPKAAKEAQPTVATTEQPVTAQEPQPPVAEEAEPTVAEETPLTPVAETQPTGIHEAHLPAMAEMQPTAVEEAQSKKAQEAQPIAEEALRATVQETQETIPSETQLTVIAKEIRTSRVEETQAIAVEEAQAIVAEETEPAATERSQQQETVKVQPEGAAKAVPEVKRGQREPIKRGGKPRGPTPDLEKGRTQGIQPRRSKPEIVCWKREQQWVLAVEVPEELLEKSGLAVLQNGSPLTQEKEKSREACWRLEQAFGEVVVRWNEGEDVQKTNIGLGQEGYLLFKLSGQNQNQGRRVKSPSSGSYLVMVPDNWDRDETLSGPPPVTPEPVYLAGYRAHFFELERGGDTKIAFRVPDSEPLVIASKATRFELVGIRLSDASESMGPLFGERPPRIRALDAQTWKDIGTVVVGEEGSGRRKWRTPFRPDLGQAEQDLPPEVAARKGGWYFLRFYDTNDDLIESLDFRFICALKEIRIHQRSPFPSVDGHGAVLVEFLHETGCTVEPADGLTNIQIKGQADKTILTISPDPTYDETRWLVCPEGGPRVEVTILVERVWWAVGEGNIAPSEWEDRLFTPPRDYFAATSKKALWLRLPRRRWVDKVLVGFERPRARPYPVKVAEKTVAIPLRDFGDSKEVGDRTQEHPFKVWIERDGRFMEGVVAVIPASQLVVAPVPVQVVPPATPYWVGFGRKKTAIAKAVLQNGSGEVEINGHPIDRYFGQAPPKAKRFLRRLLELDQIHEVLSRMEVNITVTGSGPTTMRQAKAVAHAVARALVSYDPKLTPLLKQAGFGGVGVRGNR